MIDFKKLDKSGIYRLWVEHEGEEYSYIGVSKNIVKRIRVHLVDIRGYLRDSQTKTRRKFSDALKNYSVPAKSANTFKIAFFLILNDLKMSDLKAEVLKECQWEVIEEVEKEEIELIESFNSEWRGFNGVHAKLFKYERTVHFNGLDEKISAVIISEMIRQNNRLLLEFKKNTQPMSWIFFNYKGIPGWVDKKVVTEDYFTKGFIDFQKECDLVLSKESKFQSLIDI